MALPDPEQTIAAIASPPGSGARGIIRVSGGDSLAIVASCFEVAPGAAQIADVRRPRRIPGTVRGADVSLPIPAHAMVWPNHRSYTGQPMVELHLIGSPPLLDAVLESLFAAGARGAGRGEFTLRSFLAGRLDLVQAEAVLGVIDAADHEELAAALTQLGGGMTSRLAEVRAEIIGLLGDLEAGLDFVEEDIEFITVAQICQRLHACGDTVARLLGQSATNLPSGHRMRVVLAGLPNAGKSTLFNRLVGDNRAIVSAVAGTTRDYLSADVDWQGLPVRLIDTAGWEDASDLMMERAQQQRDEQTTRGDLVLWCQSCGLTASQRPENDRLRDRLAEGNLLLCVATQTDLARPDTRLTADVNVSARTGEGMDQLQHAVLEHFRSASSARSELLASTTARCRESLAATETAITAAVEAAQAGLGDEIVAIELRAALEHLGIILGEVYTDDILDHIFSSFCIGK